MNTPCDTSRSSLSGMITKLPDLHVRVFRRVALTHQEVNVSPMECQGRVRQRRSPYAGTGGHSGVSSVNATRESGVLLGLGSIEQQHRRTRTESRRRRTISDCLQEALYQRFHDGAVRERSTRAATLHTTRPNAAPVDCTRQDRTGRSADALHCAT